MAQHKGCFRDENNEKSRPKNQHLFPRRAERLFEQEKRHQHVNGHNPHHNLGRDVDVHVHGQQDARYRCAPGTALLQAAEQKIEFQRDEPGALNVGYGNGTAKIEVSVRYSQKECSQNCHAFTGNLPRKQIGRNQRQSAANCR